MLVPVLQILDTSVTNVALPHIQSALSAGLDEVSWVLTSYLAANAIDDAPAAARAGAPVRPGVQRVRGRSGDNGAASSLDRPFLGAWRRRGHGGPAGRWRCSIGRRRRRLRSSPSWTTSACWP